MNNLEHNTTIAQRLGMGFIAIIVILLSSVLMTLWQINKLNNTIDDLAGRQIPIMQTSMDLLSSINEGSASLRGYLLTRDINFSQDNTRTWDTQITPSLSALQSQSRLWMNAQDSALVKKITDSVQAARTSTQAVKLNANQDSAIKQFAQDLAPKVNTLQEQIRQFTAIQNSIVTQGITQTKKEIDHFILFEWLILGLGLLISIILSYKISKSLVDPIKNVVSVMNDIAEGRTIRAQQIDGPHEIQLLGRSATHLVNTLNELTKNISQVSKQQYDVAMQLRSDDDKLIQALIKMTQALKENAAYYANQMWLQQGINTLSDSIAKSNDLKQLVDQTLSEICRHLNAGVGALYLNQADEQQLKLTATFSFVERENLSSIYHYGEGIIGQVALEGKPIALKNINRHDLVIQSGTTAEPPRTTYTFPLLDKTELIAVVELGFHETLTEIQLDYIRQISSTLASSIHILDQKQLTETLLVKQRTLAEELTTQQEELKTSNEELETQAEELRTSEEELRVRDEEQRTLNQALEERNQALEQQKTELEDARAATQQRAEDLVTANKYKSEFLANMSHELRTPLNSILLLSKMLSDEKKSHLNKEDLESVQVINKSAEDLLLLINDILDLSKVEAGKIKIELSKIDINQLFDEIHKEFNPIALDKKLIFNVNIIDSSIRYITSDKQRLSQILKNLLSNAFKFTDNGHITLSASKSGNGIIFSVTDTGIGIPQDKQKDIFKTFYQCDGSTHRSYAGTGLGLSISAQLATLLGGEIQVTSTVDGGSTFSLYVPETMSQSQIETKVLPPQQATAANQPHDIVNNISKTLTAADASEKLLLIVEDDPQFAQILKATCEKKGFKCIHTKTASEALKAAAEYPLLGILMDVNLPDQDGLTVADQLKQHEKTKHIPVHFISGADKKDEAMKHGAVSYIMKPITIEQLDNTIKGIENMVRGKLSHLLIVEDDKNLRNTIKKIFEDKSIQVTVSGTGKKAMTLLANNSFDCVILDLHLPDISGSEILKQLQEKNIYIPPVIIYTGKELTEDETEILENYSNNIIIKNKVSIERLMDETLLFIHHIGKQHKIDHEPLSTNKADENKLDGKKILLVDDDVRNTFALAKSLKVYGADILIAPNGKIAIELLAKEHDVSIILMDIMMPVMDGFEAIKRIRSTKQYSDLPIIALTAKAMSQDREQCLAIGATDYMAKPVDINKLLILLRAWV